VIAYDDGALSELVPASGLVPPSDVGAFAEHIESSLVRRSEPVPAMGSLDVWRTRAVEQWSSALA
jgi:hypothetical protein